MRKLTKKSIKFAGFSLMEVMVAVGLMGVLTVAITNQLQLASNTRKASTQQMIINNITDKLSVELSKQSTCSSVANFKGKLIGRVFAAGESIYAANGTTAIATSGDNYKRSDKLSSSGNMSESAGATGTSVKIAQMRTYQNPNDNNSMVLEVKFSKTGAFSVFNQTQVVTIPITIVKQVADPTKIDYCFSDVTNSIASAIRLSCQGNTSYYDSTLNLPYGACIHNVDATSCPANQFIRSLEYTGDVNGNGVRDAGEFQINKTCAGLNVSCPSGQILAGFNVDGLGKPLGTPICIYPFPNCAANQLMVKSASGPYICLNIDVGCSGFYAIKSFNSDGSVTCNQYYPPKTCASGMAYSISPDSISCSPAYQQVDCGVGQFISSFNATGVGQCTKFYEFPQNVPGGAGATGLDSNGMLTYQNLTRSLKCYGTISPTKTWDTCGAAGGGLQNLASNLQICKFGGTDNCYTGAGWQICQDWKARKSVSCTDTHSNCSTAVTSQTATAIDFSNPVHETYVQCRFWKATGSSGCIYVLMPKIYTPIYQVGCY